MVEWRASRRRFAGVAPDDGEGLAAAATALLADVAWLDALLGPLIAALRADPGYDVPLKVNRDATPMRGDPVPATRRDDQPGADIRRRGAVRAARHRRVICSGKLAVTRYLRAGGATLARWAVPRLPEPLMAAAIGPCRRLDDLALADGDIVRHDGRTGAGLLIAATDDVLTLTAALEAEADPVAREYDRATGRFLRMATNDEGAARAQLLLSLLRASGRADADGVRRRDPRRRVLPALVGDARMAGVRLARGRAAPARHGGDAIRIRKCARRRRRRSTS